MGVSWTTEQQQVIDLRDRNLLVAAAAGSGKTAVLVERIIKKITDQEKPVDIDRLLVVTFTKAAAAEMRERIRLALEKLQSNEPQNENLTRQASLIHNAQISTIDSFCLYIVRNHFGEIGLDPNFRIADTGEVHLLEKDTLAEVFENAYREGRETFLSLVDAYSDKRSDTPLREMILTIYHNSLSCPWPQEWIRGLLGIYACESQEALLETELIQDAERNLRLELESCRKLAEALRDRCLRPGGIEKYLATFEADLAALTPPEGLCYAALVDYLGQIQFKTIARLSKADAVPEEVKKSFTDARDQMKDQLKKLQNKYRSAHPDILFAMLGRQKPVVEELIRLTLDFHEAMKVKKQKRRIAEFADIEHYALNILVDPETRIPTPVAEAFRSRFEEIMIDEYQDSNQVQEEILQSISRCPEGGYNVFMVGDVKQSIYRFRQARPELFMEKYATYSAEDGPCRKIELHQNFRSRSSVLQFANDMFYKLMAADLGNVTYDKEAALYPGAIYPDNPQDNAEVLLLDRGELQENTDDEELLEEDSARLEARLIASRIRRLMAEGKVTDRETGLLRPVCYRDMVILVRSGKAWSQPFYEVLESCGIPLHVESTTGYFSAYEVQSVLNLLRLLDNPYQDIPMASVLKSPFAGLDDEDLAEIRAKHPHLTFAQAALEEMKEAAEGEEETILQNFGRKYRLLRGLSARLPIHELLSHIFRETGFDHYVAAMPAGERRKANLEALAEKAIAYEKTSYKGLFHFIRYIDQLQKYEQDFGEADLIGENADVVRLMTIHKSKGLEFPIVFVAGIGKQMNLRESKSRMILHTDLGIGLDEITPTPRLRRESPIRAQIAERLIQEGMGEELRVLYVALTRAREKLILTGSIPGREKWEKKYCGNVTEGVALDYGVRRRAGSWLDWITPAVLSYPDRYRIEFIEPADLILESVRAEAENTLDRQALYERIRRVPQEAVDRLKEAFSFSYPFASDISRKSKYSVSELKHASMTEEYDRMEGEAELPDFLKEAHESYVPVFARREELPCEDTISGEGGQLQFMLEERPGDNGGALRGTALHRVMECLDFAAITALADSDRQTVKEFVRTELDRMRREGKLDEDMYQLIDPAAVENFVRSPIGERMGRAAAAGLLFKEKPFVMSREDGVLIQGIIDVFWMEGDEIMLLDYKTDRVEKAQELVMRYRTQLELYADALERVFSNSKRKVQVKKKLIYSFRLHEVIAL